MTSWWKLAYWLTGTVGIAGVIAAFAFLPVLAQAVTSVVVRCFTILFGYRVGCAVVSALLAAFVADYVRHSIDDERHAAEVAAFVQRQAERDQRIAQQTRELVWKEIANATAENAVIDRSVKEFTDALPNQDPAAAVAGNPFRVGADAARLCHIAGATDCGPKRVEGVPAARPKATSAAH